MARLKYIATHSADSKPKFIGSASNKQSLAYRTNIKSYSSLTATNINSAQRKQFRPAQSKHSGSRQETTPYFFFRAKAATDNFKFQKSLPAGSKRCSQKKKIYFLLTESPPSRHADVFSSKLDSLPPPQTCSMIKCSLRYKLKKSIISKLSKLQKSNI